MQRNTLICIDCQKDFAGELVDNPALYVDGAREDMKRASDMIKKSKNFFTSIHSTLDTHNRIDVGHRHMYRLKDGSKPAPFTQVIPEMFEQGEIRAFAPKYTNRMYDYCKTLVVNGNYPLMIWPDHCLIGSRGVALCDSIAEAYEVWEEENSQNINFVTKGTNPFVEHYSVFRADVEDPNDPSTQLNVSLINLIEESDTIFAFGEAGSHCLWYSMRDLLNSFSNPDTGKKVHLVTDCTSPVTHPDANINDFFQKEMQAMFDLVVSKGGKLIKSTDL